MLIPSFVGILRLFLLTILFKFGAYESPGYFLANLKDGSELTKKLKKWYDQVYSSDYTDEKTQSVIISYKQAQLKEKPTLAGMVSPTYRYRFFTCCILNIMQQLGGINFLIFFSTKIFDELSGNGSTVTLVIALSNISGGILGSFTIGKFGRKFNLMYGALL